MVGYNEFCHRGSGHYLAVAPGEQGTGVGAAMMLHAEHLLRDLGCGEVDLRVRARNSEAVGLYESIGYEVDDVVPMSLRLVDDSHPSNGAESG
jgi:ribosomal protein S18 acetylase RimI-like enzyme